MKNLIWFFHDLLISKLHIFLLIRPLDLFFRILFQYKLILGLTSFRRLQVDIVLIELRWFSWVCLKRKRTRWIIFWLICIILTGKKTFRFFYSFSLFFNLFVRFLSFFADLFQAILSTQIFYSHFLNFTKVDLTILPYPEYRHKRWNIICWWIISWNKT